jgi:hypothetical protein
MVSFQEKGTSMSLTAVVAATGILTNAMKALDSLREQAKGSKDIGLKENISKLYSELLDLKAAHMRIEEENSELRRAVAQNAQKQTAPELRPEGAVHYYYLGEKGPFCQPCFLTTGKLVQLPAATDWSGGLRRQCPLCNKSFWEVPALF